MALSNLVPELYCTDFDRTLSFYTGALGFDVLYQRPHERFAFLTREGAEIMIEELGVGRKWIAGELQQPFGRGVSFQIAVSDVIKLHDSLKKAGYAFFLPLEDKWYQKNEVFVGHRQFIIQDPDGFLLRFTQSLGSKSLPPA